MEHTLSGYGFVVASPILLPTWFGLVALPGDRISLQPNVAMGSVFRAPSACVRTVELFDNFALSDWIVQPPGSTGKE